MVLIVKESENANANDLFYLIFLTLCFLVNESENENANDLFYLIFLILCLVNESENENANDLFLMNLQKSGGKNLLGF